MAEQQIDHHERLDKLMDARRAELGKDWNDIANHVGISRQSLLDFRKGKTRRLRRKSMWMLEQTLEWPPGAIEGILAGGELRRFVLPEGPGTVDVLIRLAGGETHEFRVDLGRRDPSNAVTDIKNALRSGGLFVVDGSVLEPIVRFPRDADADADVTAEDILDDPDLPPRVRRALLDAYHRLRREVVEELRKPSS